MRNRPPIEPQWAGIEDSLINLIKWICITLLFIPLALGTLMFAVANLFHISLPLGVLYGLSIIFGSIPVLKWAQKAGRLYILVGSQRVVIVTDDIPGTAGREASDSREETGHDAKKLGEGLWIVDPFWQKYADLEIEIDYIAEVEKFRITLGQKGSQDLEVKGAVATFRTDSEQSLILARISLDDNKRAEKIRTNMRKYLERFIETAFREVYQWCVLNNRDIMDHLDNVSNRVAELLMKMLEEEHWGIYLQTFTLGNVDVPEKVGTARDDAAAFIELGHGAAMAMSETNTASGLPADHPNRLSPETALDHLLVATERKKATKSEQGLKIDPATMAGLVQIAKNIAEAFKK